MNRFLRSAAVIVPVVALLLLGIQSGPLRADELYARVRGVIMDSSGAVLPDVHLKIVNLNTNLATKMDSDSDGSFTFINLLPGTYSLSVSKLGFKNFELSGITLVQTQIFIQNITLQPGSVTEFVKVSANQAQVETTSIQLATDISGRKMLDLPLSQRNWIQLQQTIPGVVSNDTRFGNNFATNGSQAQQNSFLVNGADTNDVTTNIPIVIPSPDAIGEVQILTNTINPEYGRNSGAILNAATKTGTNAFHGTAFAFFRDTSLNASNFLTRKPAIFHQHQFGGTIGGPIRKDHTFFFISYQGTKARAPQSLSVPSVFTQAQLNGDLHDANTGTCTIGNNTSPFPLQDSNGVTQPAGTSYNVLFPNCIVPTANFNAVSKKLVTAFVPLPNSGINDFVFSPSDIVSQDQTIGRVDHTFSSKDSIWIYYLWERDPAKDTLSSGGGDLPGFGQQQKSRVDEGTVAWNHLFGSMTLNEVRFGLTRNDRATVVPQRPTLPSTFGFDIKPQDAGNAGVPFIFVQGLFSLGFGTNGPQSRTPTALQFTDNFTKIAGKHSLKAGIDFIHYHDKNVSAVVNNGLFLFTGAGGFTTSIPGLDFLLGIPDDYQQSSGGVVDASAREMYAYFQDQYRVRPDLTLTLGTGYQVDSPLSQDFNHGLSSNCFVPGEQSRVFPTAPAGLVFPGDPGCNHTFGATTKYRHFGPRIGFAWSPSGRLIGASGKTSLRGGWGLYYNRSEAEPILQSLLAPPFTLFTHGAIDTGGSPAFATPFADITGNAALSTSNLFPFAPPSPGNTSVDFSPFEPLEINVLDPKFNVPYSMNYNLTFERELPGQSILRVAYVGAQGRKLISAVEANPITPAGVTACLSDPSCAPPGGTYFIQHITFPSHSVFPGNIFGGMAVLGTRGNSNYNSLQVSVNKTSAHGLTFLAAYTYSHSIDNTSSFEDLTVGGGRGSNPNLALERGDSAFDARHRFVASYTYEFPHANSTSAVARYFLNGWRISGITTLQTGFPITLSDSGLTSLQCDFLSFFSCWDRPNRVAPVKIMDPRSTARHLYFDPSSFAPAPFGTLGNAGRNFFHGPGLNQTDLTLGKETQLTESVSLEIRADFFNAFNHTQFTNVVTDVGSSRFGQARGVRNPRFIQLGARVRF